MAPSDFITTWSLPTAKGLHVSFVKTHVHLAWFRKLGISVPILMFIPPKMPRFCTIPAYCVYTSYQVHDTVQNSSGYPIKWNAVKGQPRRSNTWCRQKSSARRAWCSSCADFKGLHGSPSHQSSLSWRSRIRKTLKPTFSTILDLAGLIFSDLWCLVPDIPNVLTL